jgi:TRAP-type mannitol/chloroaromatic compound transport system permease small subunit
MHKLKIIADRIDRLNDWLGKIFSFSTVIIVGLVTYAVIARYALRAPSRWAAESSLLGFAAYAILMGGYALLHKAHVNMDVFYSRWKPRTKDCRFHYRYMFLFFLHNFVLVWERGFYSLAPSS